MTSTETRTVRELAEEVASYSCPCEPCKTIFAFVARIETLEKALREILPLAVNDSPGGCDGKTPGCPNCEAIKNARAALSPPSDNEVK